MPNQIYENFDLLITRTARHYVATVIQSPGGETSRPHRFKLPFSATSLTNQLDLVGGALRHLNTYLLERAMADENAVLDPKTFGGRLFEAVFANQVKDLWQRSLALVEPKGAGLRLRLRLADAPELADLPWEYLYNPDSQRFYCLSESTPVVRYLHVPETDLSLAVSGPLHILVVLADPSDAIPRLQVNSEWQRLRQALSKLQKQGKVVLEPLKKATLGQIQRRLRQPDPVHIIHFIGHGYFDETSQSGGLQLEDEGGAGQFVSGETLGVLFRDQQTLRLIFLNACEGARAAQAEPFAGTAQLLVHQGISAVIAMQFAVTDQAALTLAPEFYRALADHYPVDAALTEARKALFFSGSVMEWGTPVLFMRTPDGRLFTDSTQPASATPPAPAEGPPAAGDVQINLATGGGQISNSSITFGNITVKKRSR